jgi:hypothetical protein
LRAGILESGEWTETVAGTPQGARISPLLANIFLHYVFDLWVAKWRRGQVRGDMIVIRYADDTLFGFEHEKDAGRMLSELSERFGKFGLRLHEEKTRLIEFGRYAAERRAKRGERRPETFDFLGFTHCSSGWLLFYAVTMPTVVFRATSGRCHYSDMKCASCGFGHCVAGARKAA